MAQLVLGPPGTPASFSPTAVTHANKRTASEIGAAGRGEFFLLGDLLIQHVDRKSKFVAADAGKFVDALGAARGALKQDLRGVLLFGPEQAMCQREDKPERARRQLAEAGVSVYRLPA